MTTGFAASGTYTSAVLDAQQVSRFGQIQLHGSLPEGTTLKLSTRSGNVGEPTEIGWSNWSDPKPATEFSPVTSPSARFLQYRLSFTSTDGKRSAVVDDVDVAYQEPNVAPEVKSVKITIKGAPDATANGANAPANHNNGEPPPDARYRTITWEASDANDDELSFSLYFRNGSKSEWILLKNKLKDMTYDWDTQSVADGRYEVKVIASDELANAVGRQDHQPHQRPHRHRQHPAVYRAIELDGHGKLGSDQIPGVGPRQHPRGVRLQRGFIAGLADRAACR